MAFLILILFGQVDPGFGQDSFRAPVERLAKLLPENITAYRDLAEELSIIRNSPEARNLSIRLYLIAAYHGKEKIRRSALRGLIQSARSAREKKAFQIVAYLEDPGFANILLQLQPSTSTSSKLDTSRPAAADKLLDAIGSLRKGKPSRAQKLIQEVDVAEYFKRYREILTLNEFLEICQRSTPTREELYKLIKIDLKTRGKLVDSGLRQADLIWKDLLENRLPPRTRELSLTTVTEFNPLQSIYRSGSWRKP